MEENLAMNSVIKKIVNIFTISAIAFLIYSCEDDAILTPKQDDGCAPGDSYCNLSMPGDKIQLVAYNPDRY